MTSAVQTPESNRVVFKGWLPAQEAADYLGVSREYVYRLKSIYEEGGAGLPGFYLGDTSHVLMFRQSDLDAYKRTHPELAKNRRTVETAAGSEIDGNDDVGDTKRTPEPDEPQA